ncbi:MAG: tyrosine-type recombinase/integrase [Tabrizicola sp.]|jgi:integrase|nr:tyrosine-type recombinase/integrase [Tabrizicola sp.]
MKQKRQFPGASPYTDRHGQRRWRFRKGGFSRELGTAYGSPEFRWRYEAAVQEHRTGQKAGTGVAATVPGSVNDLVASWYRSPEWAALAELTKKTYRGVVEPFREKHGDKPVNRMERRHVMAFLAEKAETPVAANNLRKRLGQLLDHAIALDWIKANPARLTRPYKIAAGGFHPWDEGEIARFFEVYQPGTMAHRAVTLMLYTGAARVDAVKLGPMNLKGDRIEYRRQKTAKTNGVLVTIPLHPDLAEVLAALPNDRPFLATAYGKSRSPDGLGNLMREWCDTAGLPECSAHGLRKACARRLAEAGATAHEIMAVTGHKTLAEVQRYTDTAVREGLADSAMAKLVARPNGGKTVVNLPQKFAKKSSQVTVKKG